MHNTSINAFANSLRDSWVVAIKNHVRTCLKDMGKGWYNLNESDNEVRAAAVTICCLPLLSPLLLAQLPPTAASWFALVSLTRGSSSPYPPPRP